MIAEVTAFVDAEALVPATDIGRFEALDLTWRGLECRSADGLEQACSAPSEEASLVSLTAPFVVRTAADGTRVLRWQQFDSAAGAPTPTAMVYKTWDSAVPDRSVAWIRDRLASSGSTWETAEAWRGAAVDLLRAELVASRDFALTPGSGAAVNALEALVHWQAGLDGGVVVLGHELGAEPTETVRALEGYYAGFYPEPDSGLPATGGLDHLMTDLEALIATGGEADRLRSAAEFFYAGYLPAEGRPATTDIELADTLENAPGALTAARYATRALLITGAPRLDALLPAARAELLDPTGDVDGDGLTNESEVARLRLDGSAAADLLGAPPAMAADADGDGLTDDRDACPDDATQDCLTAPSLVADTDLDGTPDALDNCLNTANPDQRDDDVDGVGDACPGLAVIVSPTAHLTIATGRIVDFRSHVTAAGAGRTLAYAWTFEGAAPDRAVPQPGAVYFAEPGTYHVRLRVTSGAEVSEDLRTLTVVGPSLGLPDGLIGAEAATEGLSTALSVVSPQDHGFGPLTAQWTFGDGSPAVEAPGVEGLTVNHTWMANGDYVIGLVLTDSRGASRLITRTVSVADAGPVPDFTYVSAAFDRQLALTDATHSTDAIVSYEWSFGDGTPTAVGPAVTHTWLLPGAYDVTLAVMDSDGTEAHTTVIVHVTGSGIQLFTVAAGDAWVRASYPVAMADPVVVAGPAGTAAADPGAIRIRNVDATGFEVRFAEWSNLDGAHGAETLPILAMERGHYRLEDGTEIEADAFVASGTSLAKVINFARPFVATPRIFTSLQSAEDAAPATARISGPTRKAFSALLNEEELTMGSAHLGEEVGYIAVYRAGNLGNLVVNGATTAYTAPAVAIGQVPVLTGGCRLNLAEDTTFDAEILHKKETVSVLSLLGQCFAQSTSKAELDPFVIRRLLP